jgi:hypothetical protein
MDLQTRKLRAISYLIGLDDEKSFERIEAVIGDVQKQVADNRYLEQISAESLVQRAKQSTDDYLKGRVLSQEQLEKDSENW